MKDNDITVSDLAGRLGYSYLCISNFLNGKKLFSDDFYKKSCEALGLSEYEISIIFNEANNVSYLNREPILLTQYK